MNYETWTKRQFDELERMEARPDRWFVNLAIACTFLSTVIIVGVLTHRWLVLSLPNIGVN